MKAHTEGRNCVKRMAQNGPTQPASNRLVMDGWADHRVSYENLVGIELAVVPRSCLRAAVFHC